MARLGPELLRSSVQPANIQTHTVRQMILIGPDISVPAGPQCYLTFSVSCWHLAKRTLFSVPQIEYPLRGSCKKGSHVYFLFHVFWVILLFDINVVLMLPWWPDVTIVQPDVTIVVPWQLSTGSKHDYLFATAP